jgi:hypothetical protein
MMTPHQQNTFRGCAEFGARLYNTPLILQMMNEENILFLFSVKFSNLLCRSSNLQRF